MNPLGIFQFALAALEGVVHAVNPKLRKKETKSGIAFGIVYIALLIGGTIIVVMVVRSLYF